MTVYKSLTYVNLPVVDVMKSPGDEITDEELEAAGQDEEAVQSLLDSGAISTDMEAPLHPDHLPVDTGTLNINGVVAQARSLIEQLQAEGKEVPAELASFAQLDVRGVLASDEASTSEEGGS